MYLFILVEKYGCGVWWKWIILSSKERFLGWNKGVFGF